MNCPFCNKAVSATSRYCPFCGKKVDVTFEEIRRGMASEQQSEKQQAKARESRRILAIALFLFVVSIIVYIAIPSPSLPDAVPVYRIEVPEDPDVEVQQVDAPEFKIPR